MSTSRVFQPFQAYAKEFTARLRLRSHPQSFSEAVQQRVQRRLSPAGAITVQRVNELDELVQRHRRTFDPTLKARAMQLLTTLPLLAADEDPHLSVTQRALRGVAYLDAAHMPIAFSLLDHITRHTYMLDGFALCSLLTTLRRLRHPQTLEALEILLPRLREVAKAAEVTATEAARILEVLRLYELNDVEVQRALCAIISHTWVDLSTPEVRECIGALSAVSREVAEPTLKAVGPHLCERLAQGTRQYVALRSVFAQADSGANDTGADGAAGLTGAERASAVQELHELRQLMRALCDCAIHLTWAPRRVLDELVAAALIWSEPSVPQSDTSVDTKSSHAMPPHLALPQLSRLDLCVVVQMLRCTNYRHDRALLQLSTRIATTPRPVSSLLSSPDVSSFTDSHAANNVAALVQVWEAMAHFRCPGAMNVLPTLLEELTHVFSPTLTLQRSSAMGNTDGLLLLSRLLHCVATLDVVAAQATPDVLPLVERLCTCPLLTDYVNAGGRGDDDDATLRTTLLSALATLSAQLEQRYTASQEHGNTLAASDETQATRWQVVARLMTSALAQLQASSSNLAGVESVTQAVRVLCATPAIRARASQYMPLHELQKQWLE